MGDDVRECMQDVVIRIPSGCKFQLIFRQELTSPLYAENRDELSFVFLATPIQAVGSLSVLWHLFPTPLRQGCKLLLKLASRRRFFYYIQRGDQIVHYGWATVSLCRYYRVAKGDVVIGPIWTSSTCRRQGIAVYATRLAINRLFELGFRVFYIDTVNTNVASLSVIRNCGFGNPIGCFHRWW